MKIEIAIPATFQDLFEPQITGTKYWCKVYYGGRSGCKSHSFARALLVLGIQHKLRILCLREYYNSIADSVKSLLDNLIEDYELQGHYTSTNTEITGSNGTSFIFGGLKINNKNIKGKERIDICWVEEAQTVSQDSWDLLIPTIIRNPGSEVWISFNPYLASDPVNQFLKGRKNVFIKKVTHRDNPFITQNEKDEMEYMRSHNYDKYLHIWEGEFLSISDAAVFKDCISIQNFEKPQNIVKYGGIDFGFSQDYFAIISIYIDQNNRILYIYEAARKIKLEIEHTPAFIENNITDAKSIVFVADSARPEMIQYLRRRGFKIMASKKGPGSVIEGIEFLRNFKITINEKLKDVISEFSGYCYKTDPRTNLILPVLEDKDNHYIDATRYASEPSRKPPAQVILA